MPSRRAIARDVPDHDRRRRSNDRKNSDPKSTIA
jgi:hypothetical protein